MISFGSVPSGPGEHLHVLRCRSAFSDRVGTINNPNFAEPLPFCLRTVSGYIPFLPQVLSEEVFSTSRRFANRGRLLSTIREIDMHYVAQNQVPKGWSLAPLRLVEMLPNSVSICPVKATRRAIMHFHRESLIVDAEGQALRPPAAVRFPVIFRGEWLRPVIMPFTRAEALGIGMAREHFDRMPMVKDGDVTRRLAGVGQLVDETEYGLLRALFYHWIAKAMTGPGAANLPLPIVMLLGGNDNRRAI